MGESIRQKLNRLAKESEQELIAIGLGSKIPCGIIYEVNMRAKKRFGQCCAKRNINISSWLLEIGTDEEIKNTIIHEILHTFEDTQGHDYKWKYYARFVNERTNYNIARTDSISQVYKRANVKQPLDKYKIICLGCGATYYKSRIQGTTLYGYKHGHRRHTSCGCNEFKVIDTRTNKVIVNGVEV